MQGEVLKISLNKELTEKFLLCLMDDLKKIAIEQKKERDSKEQKVM